MAETCLIFSKLPAEVAGHAPACSSITVKNQSKTVYQVLENYVEDHKVLLPIRELYLYEKISLPGLSEVYSAKSRYSPILGSRHRNTDLIFYVSDSHFKGDDVTPAPLPTPTTLPDQARRQSQPSASSSATRTPAASPSFSAPSPPSTAVTSPDTSLPPELPSTEQDYTSPAPTRIRTGPGFGRLAPRSSKDTLIRSARLDKGKGKAKAVKIEVEVESSSATLNPAQPLRRMRSPSLSLPALPVASSSSATRLSDIRTPSPDEEDDIDLTPFLNARLPQEDDAASDESITRELESQPVEDPGRSSETESDESEQDRIAKRLVPGPSTRSKKHLDTKRRTSSRLRNNPDYRDWSVQPQNQRYLTPAISRSSIIPRYEYRSSNQVIATEPIHKRGRGRPPMRRSISVEVEIKSVSSLHKRRKIQSSRSSSEAFVDVQALKEAMKQQKQIV